MKDNVILFNGVTSLDLPADRVCMKAAEANLNRVLIIGTNQDESLYFASSFPDGGHVLWMMEIAKKLLMEGT